jgi:hypothetical protein
LQEKNNYPMKKLIFSALVLACSCLTQAQVKPQPGNTKNSQSEPGGTDSVISGGKIFQGGKGQKKPKTNNYGTRSYRGDSLQRSKQHKASQNNSGMRQEHGTLKTKPSTTVSK